MERDNKIVLGAVLILLVGMLSFNFAGSLTGKVSNEEFPDVEVRAMFQGGGYEETFGAQERSTSRAATVTVNVRSGKAEREVDLCRKGPRGECEVIGGRRWYLSASSSVKAPFTKTHTETLSQDLLGNEAEAEFFWRVQARRSSGQSEQNFYSESLTLKQNINRGNYNSNR